MRSSTAYFAGAGTIIVAIAGGLGGGMLISSIVSPQQEKHGSLDPARLERRVSPEPIPASSKSLEPVPYLAAPQVSAAVADSSPPPQPAAEQTKPQPPAPQPATQAAAQPAPPSPPAAQPAAEPPAARERTTAEDSVAKTRDADAKARDADVKREPRRAEEKRRAERRPQWADERRQQWAERRKPRGRDGDDLREVERAIREDTGPRESFAAESVRMEMPRIKLFDME
jgi:hypothetical protein